MKIKTTELIGPDLDWAVAQAQGYTTSTLDLLFDIKSYSQYHPSTDWAQGGPILEREKIGIWPSRSISGMWAARLDYVKHERTPIFYGPTPLIAAMRCRVSAKLGDEVDVPDELTPVRS